MEAALETANGLTPLLGELGFIRLGRKSSMSWARNGTETVDLIELTASPLLAVDCGLYYRFMPARHLMEVHHSIPSNLAAKETGKTNPWLRDCHFKLHLRNPDCQDPRADLSWTETDGGSTLAEAILSAVKAQALPWWEKHHDLRRTLDALKAEVESLRQKDRDVSVECEVGMRLAEKTGCKALYEDLRAIKILGYQARMRDFSD